MIRMQFLNDNLLRMSASMRLKFILPAALLVATAACDSILDVQPTTTVTTETAINNPNSARAALAGLYDGLQSTSYYGGDFVLLMDLSSDNAVHAGTFTDYADADANDLTADNGDVLAMWSAMYAVIGDANSLIARVPSVALLPAPEVADIVAQARAARAVAYFDLLRVWVDRSSNLGVPVVTTPVTKVSEIPNATRADTAAVYAQILNDLNAAATGVTNTDPSRITRGFVLALRSKVQLYRRQWAAARDDAAAVLAISSYALAPTYQALFTADGGRTSEDILRLTFTDQDAMNLGFYYLTRGLGGRREVAPSSGLRASYEAGDVRRDVTVGLSGSTRYGRKWPTPAGAEDVHVIRLGEVILNKAEAHAQLNELAQAVVEYNKIRVRAGLAPHVLGVNVITQADVLAAVYRERRSELALEGDRWPDLVRRGIAASTLGIPVNQTRYPIPQRERDVSPGVAQNPGY